MILQRVQTNRNRFEVQYPSEKNRIVWRSKKNISFVFSSLVQVVETKGDILSKKFGFLEDSRYTECMKMTGDFETDVQRNYYAWIQDQRWLNRKNPEVLNTLPVNNFHQDFTDYLIRMGVPVQYASKVASYAWQEGHSSGYQNVLNVAGDLIEIFK